MASNESPAKVHVSTPAGCQPLSHSSSPAADEIKYPKSFVDITTSGTADLPQYGLQPSRRRRSLLADEVLPIGLIEHASTAGCYLEWENISVSRASLRRSGSCATANQRSMAVEKVQRWSGMTRTVSDWDGLRRVCCSCFACESSC